MSDAVGVAVSALRGFTRTLDPACIDARHAKRLLEQLAEATRLCQGATTLLAARVATTKAWGDDGARSPAEYVSKVTGSPLGQAIGMLETAERLASLPATEAALRAGDLSPAQAHAVAEAATADPDAEEELLEQAARASVRGLQMKARTIEAAACPERTEARYRAAHADRDLATWVDSFGVGRLAWRGTPDALAWIRGALEPYLKHEVRAARKAGRDDTYGNCAADAFVAMVRCTAGDPQRDGGSAATRRPIIRARVDYADLVTGKLGADAVCEIEGIGPVPLSVMERLVDEHPLVDAVLTKGRDVTRIAHLGRSGDTFLKAALEWRDSRGVVTACDHSDYLEAHHLVAVEDGGVSSLRNEVRLCGHHHDLITNRAFRLIGDLEHGFEVVAPHADDPPDTG